MHSTTYLNGCFKKTVSQNEADSREHLTLDTCQSTISTKCLTKFNCCECRSFSTLTSVISRALTLIHCSASLPPPSPFSSWLETFLCPRHTTQHIMDVVIASIFLQERGGGELLQEGPASFLQGVPIRTHCPLVNTQNQQPQLPGSRVKTSLHIKHNQICEDRTEQNQTN